MKFETFLTKNKIQLLPLAEELCHEALTIMKRSKDSLHDEQHIFRLLSNLSLFLANERTIQKSKINFNVLLLAICWHDVWEAKYLPKNIPLILFNQIFEGLASMWIFSRKAKRAKLPNDITKKVKYAIRKHSRFQLFPIKTPEAQILKDVDVLDLWSMERLKFLIKKFPPSKISPILFKFGIFYFRFSVIKESTDCLNFSWSKKECQKRQEVFLKNISQYIPQYIHLL